VAGTGAGRAITDFMQVVEWSPLSRIAPVQAAAQMFNFRNPRVALQATRDVVGFVGVGLSMLGLAKLAGAKVTLNPTSTDFGKIEAGNVHINLWGTSQPLARTVARVIKGVRIDSSVGAIPTNRLLEAQNYITSGFAPEWSAIWDVIHGTEFPGQPILRGSATDIAKREALNRFAPLVLQDILDAAAAEGMITGMAVAPLSFFGASVSSYEPSITQRLRAIPQYGGLTPRQSYDVGQFFRVANTEKNKYREKYGEVMDNVPSQELYYHIAQDLGYDETTALAASVLVSSTKTRDAARNPEWIRFVVENYDELKENSPGIVDKKWIIDLVNARERELAGAAP